MVDSYLWRILLRRSQRFGSPIPTLDLWKNFDALLNFIKNSIWKRLKHIKVQNWTYKLLYSRFSLPFKLIFSTQGINPTLTMWRIDYKAMNRDKQMDNRSKVGSSSFRLIIPAQKIFLMLLGNTLVHHASQNYIIIRVQLS